MNQSDVKKLNEAMKNAVEELPKGHNVERFRNEIRDLAHAIEAIAQDPDEFLELIKDLSKTLEVSKKYIEPQVDDVVDMVGAGQPGAETSAGTILLYKLTIAIAEAIVRASSNVMSIFGGFDAFKEAVEKSMSPEQKLLRVLLAALKKK